MLDMEMLRIEKHLTECRYRNLTGTELTVSQQTAEYLLADRKRELLWALSRAGYEPYAVAIYKEGKLRIRSLLCCADPGFFVATRQELGEALRKARVRGLQKFRVMMPKEMLAQLGRQDKKELHQIEKESAIVSADRTLFPGIGMIVYSAVYIAGQSPKEVITYSVRRREPERPKATKTPEKTRKEQPPVLKSIRDVMLRVERETNELSDKIELSCSPDLFRTLFEGVPDRIGNPIRRIDDIAAMNGMFHWICYIWKDACKISLEHIVYYPGYHIIRMLRMGKESSIPDREKQTLEAAKRLVAGIYESGPAELALAISQAIGKRTVYTIDETTDEDDCAIGPLLNGQANCDGYADAFYLCASLAGLVVRYQMGCSRLCPHGSSRYNGGLHMWNLIRINNQWTIIDPTWDSGAAGLYFMIGKDRAENSYNWNHEIYPSLPERTDPHRTTAIREFVCGTREEVTAVFRDMIKKKAPYFFIIPTQQGILDRAEDISYYMKRAGIRQTIAYLHNRECGVWRIIYQKEYM